jgi:protein-S-isoprenylcysteine O-methyltransferase Ste14
MSERNNKKMKRAGIKQVLLSSLLLIIQMIIFFLSVGHINVSRAWIFFGATFVYLSVSTAVLYRFNPELIVHRLRRKREGSKVWDEILMRASNLMVMLVVPAVAGLDVGRFQWSSISIHFAVVGFVLYIFSSVLINWAMIVNPHFEATVRIQKDRDHQVISTGPYKIVRHPGYLSGILWTLSIPLIIGSIFTFIPVGIYVILFIIRASLEDRTLQKELDGYSEYAKRVRYRLFPGIW